MPIYGKFTLKFILYSGQPSAYCRLPQACGRFFPAHPHRPLLGREAFSWLAGAPSFVKNRQAWRRSKNGSPLLPYTGKPTSVLWWTCEQRMSTMDGPARMPLALLLSCYLRRRLKFRQRRRALIERLADDGANEIRTAQRKQSSDIVRT